MLPVARPSLPPLEKYLEFLKDIWQSRMLSNFGKYAHLFEAKAQDYLNNPWARAVVNGDVGLILALAALELPNGSECLVPSFTFNSTINAILWNRLRPVFVDIRPDTFNVDVHDVARRLSSSPAAVVATHVFGSPAAIDPLLDLAAEKGIPLVFDAAHAFGAMYRGRKIGDPAFGDFQVFSFSGTKQVTSGEGGLLAMGKEEYVGRIEKLRAYGFQYDYISEYVGLNGKMSELHAALASLTLDEVDAVASRRGELAQRYRKKLGGQPNMGFQEHLFEVRPTYKDFAILCPHSRDDLAAHLGRLGVQTKKYFYPLHTMPAYQAFRSENDDLRDTEGVYAKILCLPIYNELAEADVDRVSEMILDFYVRFPRSQLRPAPGSTLAGSGRSRSG